MEPPSPTLSAALRDLRLATPRDLRRAGARCRAIARDLPAFDCVWIDALLGLRRITPFQAARLQDGEADRLRLGRYVLRDRLSRGCDGETFLARPLEGGPSCVLKALDLSSDRSASAGEAMRAALDRTRTLRTSHVVVPHEMFEEAGRLVLVSRYVSGRDVRSFLIRRGRLSGDEVAEVARQLLGGLAELHRAGLVHGEIRLANLRLSRRGDATLVDAGVRPASSPILVVDDSRPPEWYDGSAPERVGTAAPASPAADIYALGCLLWHLLAGRPAFPTGDTIAKLTAHKTRAVPDVRDFAPDAPAELVGLVTEMTGRDPASRPVSAGGLQRRLRRLARPMRHSFVGISRSGRRNSGVPSSAIAALLFALAGTCLWLVDRGGPSALLTAATSDRRVESLNGPTEPSLAQLPPPDASGVLNLEHAGPFAAADVTFRGPLVLRGSSDRLTTVLVTDRPLHLNADEVTLENVRFLYEPPAGGSVPALALVETQNLVVRSCRFEGAIRPLAERAGAPAAVAWRLIDRADPTGGRLEIANCVCRGARELLYAADPPRRVGFENVLGVGLRSLLSLGAKSRRSVAADLKSVTLRDAASVVSARNFSGSIDVTAEDSIVALGPDGSLVASVASENPPDYRWSGSGVVTTFDAAREPDGHPRKPVIGASATQVDGVSRAEISFAGRADGSDAASVARVRGAPRVAGHVPGVDLARLPREIHAPVRVVDAVSHDR